MKTIVFLLMSSCFVNLTTNSLENADQPTKTPEVGRQCCTILYNFKGYSISATACSGWLLSDNAESYENACNKARQAIGQIP